MTDIRTPEYVCKSLADAFIYDSYRRYRDRFRISCLYGLLLDPAYLATVLFRIQQYLFKRDRTFRVKRGILNRFLAHYYSVLGLFVRRLNFILSAGFQGSSLADVKPGLFIHHCQGIIIGGDTKIGTNCHLFKNVLFGVKNGAYPVIKDNVTVYANAVIIGPVTVADNAVIVPNSVVIDDVEKNMIVAGIPAGPVKENKYKWIQKNDVPIEILGAGEEI